ncbi:hypothetical protein BGZ74_010906 [Mortierella antarctica]|nr:hypothetical protein BGZ74_010906 [Mortierella antarctica]
MLNQFDANAIPHPQSHQDTKQHQQGQQQQQQHHHHYHYHSHRGQEQEQHKNLIHDAGFVQTLYGGDHQPAHYHQGQDGMSHMVPISSSNLEQPSPLMLNREPVYPQHPHHHHPSLESDSSQSPQPTMLSPENTGQGLDQQFQRKRSLSVPLLFSNQNPGVESPSKSGNSTSNAQEDNEHRQQEHHMDTDMESSHTSTTTALPQPVLATMTSYSHTRMDRSSNRILPSMLPQRHRVLYGRDGGDHDNTYLNDLSGSHSHPHHYQLYYNHSIFRHSHRGLFTQHHHHHRPFQYHSHRHQGPHHHQYLDYYNPFSHRKFPAHQHWATSAQRDYHLSTIGRIGRISGGHEEEADTAEFVEPMPILGTGTDLVLRAAQGSPGITKTQYRSRLPVHLRHITSRSSRRPAVYMNPLQQQQQQQLEQRSTKDEDDMVKRILDGLDCNGSTTVLPLEHLLDTPLFSNQARQETTVSSSSSSSTRNMSQSTRDGLSSSGSRVPPPQESRRVTARSSLSDSTESAIKRFSDLSISSSSNMSTEASSSLRNRLWKTQRGGLANLIQSTGPSPAGAGTTNAVDRLVEEMNKWAV